LGRFQELDGKEASTLPERDVSCYNQKNTWQTGTLLFQALKKEAPKSKDRSIITAVFGKQGKEKRGQLFAVFLRRLGAAGSAGTAPPGPAGCGSFLPGRFLAGCLRGSSWVAAAFAGLTFPPGAGLGGALALRLPVAVFPRFPRLTRLPGRTAFPWFLRLPAFPVGTASLPARAGGIVAFFRKLLGRLWLVGQLVGFHCGVFFLVIRATAEIVPPQRTALFVVFVDDDPGCLILGNGGVFAVEIIGYRNDAAVGAGAGGNFFAGAGGSLVHGINLLKNTTFASGMHHTAVFSL